MEEYRSFECLKVEEEYAASLLVIQRPVDQVQNPDLILDGATDNLRLILINT